MQTWSAPASWWAATLPAIASSSPRRRSRRRAGRFPRPRDRPRRSRAGADCGRSSGVEVRGHERPRGLACRRRVVLEQHGLLDREHGVRPEHAARVARVLDRHEVGMGAGGPLAGKLQHPRRQRREQHPRRRNTVAELVEVPAHRRERLPVTAGLGAAIDERRVADAEAQLEPPRVVLLEAAELGDHVRRASCIHTLRMPVATGTDLVASRISPIRVNRSSPPARPGTKSAE